MSVQNTDSVSFCDKKKVHFAPLCNVYTYVLTQNEIDYKHFWYNVIKSNLKKIQKKDNQGYLDEDNYVFL